MGPYTVRARSKKDDSAFVVVLCTKVRFLTNPGLELPEARIEEAASNEEMLTSIMLCQEGSRIDNKPPR